MEKGFHSLKRHLSPYKVAYSSSIGPIDNRNYVCTYVDLINNYTFYSNPPIKKASFRDKKIVFNTYGILKQFGDKIIIEIDKNFGKYESKPVQAYEYESEFNSESRTIYSYADINILDASNLRLSNISLAYQMPKDIIKRVKLDGVRFNLNAENVYTFAKSRDAKYMLGGFISPSFVMGVNVNF